jgi:hypothetical protein
MFETDQNGSMIENMLIMLAREDVEVHHHAV